MARRDHSRAELARKLSRGMAGGDESGSEREVLEHLLDDLAARGWLSEARYAENLVRQSAAKYGTRRIQEKLRQNGVPQESARAATAYLAASEPSRAGTILRRKFPNPPANRLEWARQARFLQGRGFAPDVIHQVLNAIEQE